MRLWHPCPTTPKSTYVARRRPDNEEANLFQPGHEYTKANVKFCMKVSQTEPIKKLQAFAEANQQTQGKFTIGDEKVRSISPYMENSSTNRRSSCTMCSCASM